LNAQKKIEEKNIEMILVLKVRKVKKIKDLIVNQEKKNLEKREAKAAKRNRITHLKKFMVIWIQIHL